MPYKYDFKEIAEEVDIKTVLDFLHVNYKVEGNDLRAACPACNGSDRTLEIKLETNSFRCYAAPPPPGHQCLTGDCIDLYVHLQGGGKYQAAKTLKDKFGTATAARTTPSTPPQKPEGGTATPRAQPAPKTQGFDASTFGDKLTYSEEVAAIELSEGMATSIRVGMHRGALYLPVCPPGVKPIGFAQYKDGKLRLPDKWLQLDNVVPMPKRRA